MKQSAKAKRIARHKKRGLASGKLNLVSLMDIFTILVFFLMVNSSSDVQVLNRDGKIDLPISSAERLPDETLVITVSQDAIIIAGREIISRSDFSAFNGDIEPKVAGELRYQLSRSTQSEQSRPITVMADKDLPYSFLKKLMSTCIETGYTTVALAVNRKAQAS
ncbi:RNA polymerase subunit sigma-70 [Oleiphilus sp. HI0071]|uniref:ExbD/TolR family protein n=1 Tax=unclassified Oleiphilus TaxID=2631174 RepID=UPI0007C401FA|nr:MULTISPECIES: biopolymer transporter ExbD [unclassified Oleiphilus]KZY62602.1 RNA polymerase subunit sigma-70 [Oleiphilus sp. HI0065]KZY80064.1 RNA polymerase subunit sigma-70 [Oleiphilus sp. HI0071]KZY96672.1 RNA polymerase subunit sigma-70 [Oleiphilus sp. HI0073]KZZ40887.1 RNA polymerase subunit sigma-70 [Oleiphilus sp. HI0118]KZZ48016.1 RNA polymerase subunit sigma-70 [Oleiphilus sp. HI0122]KZZ74196.1 RNA polymerase subunit sigma-70 [Oleiphilus sp. HI0133]